MELNGRTSLVAVLVRAWESLLKTLASSEVGPPEIFLCTLERFSPLPSASLVCTLLVILTFSGCLGRDRWSIGVWSQLLRAFLGQCGGVVQDACLVV